MIINEEMPSSLMTLCCFDNYLNDIVQLLPDSGVCTNNVAKATIKVFLYCHIMSRCI